MHGFPKFPIVLPSEDVPDPFHAQHTLPSHIRATTAVMDVDGVPSPPMISDSFTFCWCITQYLLILSYPSPAEYIFVITSAASACAEYSSCQIHPL